MSTNLVNLLVLVQLILLTILQINGNPKHNSHRSQAVDQLINRKLLETIRSYMDLQADPCENFYNYACGNWENVQRQDQNYIDSIGRMEHEFNKELTKIFERVVVSEKSHNELYRKLKDHYLACRATKNHDMEHYLNLLTPVYDTVEAQTALPHRMNEHNETLQINGFNWLLTLGKLRTFGLNNVILREDIKQYNGTLYNIELAKPESVDWTSKELGHVRQLEGSQNRKDRHMAEKLLEFQESLAAIHTQHKDRKKPQYFTLRQILDSGLDELDLRGFLQQVFRNQTESVNDEMVLVVLNMLYLRELVPLMKRTDTETSAYYIMLKLKTYLEKELPQSNKPEQCMQFMRQHLPLAFDYLYEHELYAAQRNATDAVIKRVFNKMQRKFLHIIDEHSTDLTAEELDFLRLKVQHMRINIGNLPDVNSDADFFIDYHKKLQIQRTNFAANFLSALQHLPEREHFLLQLHAPAVDHTFFRWRYPSPAYQEYANMVVIPFAYLREPVFQHHYHDLFLFAELGNTLGHEMIHGFDKLGLKYDAWGNPSKIYASAMKRPQFVEAINCLKREPTSSINEKIADFNGVRLAFETHFKRAHVPQFDMEHTLTNKQLFFIKFAQFFCAISPDRIMYDSSHDTPFKRVPQAVANSREFAKEFGCAKNTTMNPHFRCNLW